ncbi:MAG: alpha/beta hydrolase [Synergistaceae bacterium]|nr:alpha/beta hydrolase [Synergistaceae bacterium]
MQIEINGIPAKIFGTKSEKAYLYVHGMMGRKEDAEFFSRVVGQRGFQVISFDLPGHGERDKNVTPDPFNTLPELEAVKNFARSKWRSLSLYAVSIGAWFSLLGFRDEPFERALLVSPVVNMKSLIERMMKSCGVTAEILRERKIIPEANLSWEYYSFACQNEINNWNCETAILYPEHDNITPRYEIEQFARRFKCELTVLLGSEHWIHEIEHVKILREWEEEKGG